MAKFLSTKNYGNDRGLSCCFRQWRSVHSHCSTLHGYSIGIKLVFESETLDDRNWVFDFGGLKAFKAWSEHMFDHTLVVAQDDPHLAFFQQMADLGNQSISNIDNKSAKPHLRGAICDLRIVEAVGCEKFAELAYRTMNDILHAYQAGNSWSYVDAQGIAQIFENRYPVGQGVTLRSVEVFEHNANSATYEG